MSKQSQGTSLFSPADPAIKRKRGRPRKDDNQLQWQNSPILPGSESMKKNEQIVGVSTAAIDDMVGQVVSGVIEGSFDAGYLLHVKVGDTDTQLRGVVFLPGRFTPVTAANDVAPNAKMYKRKEILVPVQNPQSQHHDFVVPSEQICKHPTEYKMDAPKFPDLVPPPEVQSRVPTAGENQSDSAVTPKFSDRVPHHEVQCGVPTAGENQSDFAVTPKFPDQVPHPEAQSGVPTACENQSDSAVTPKFPDLVPPPVVQSGAQTAGENQSDSAMTPLVDKLPMKTGLSSGEKVVPQQILDFRLENQTASIMAQLKHDKVVKQDQIQQDTIMDIEAYTELEPASAPSEPVSALIVDLMPCSENVDREPQVEHQPLSSDPKPSDLVHEELKSLNSEDNQTALLTKPESISSEPIGIGIFMGNPILEYNQTSSAEPKSISTQPLGTDIITEKQNSPRKYAPEYALLELANKTIGGDEKSLTVGIAANITSGGYDTSLPVVEAANISTDSYDTSVPVHEAANITAGCYNTSLPVGEATSIISGGSYSVPMTNLSVSMVGGEAISTEPKLGTEESVLPRINDTQIYSSSAATNDADPDPKAVMTRPFRFI